MQWSQSAFCAIEFCARCILNALKTLFRCCTYLYLSLCSVRVYLCICGFIKCSMRDANNTRHATQFIRCERASGVATVFTNRKVFLEMVSTFLRTNYGKSSVIDWNIERSQIEYFIEFNKKFNYSLFPEWSGNNTHTQTEKKIRCDILCITIDEWNYRTKAKNDRIVMTECSRRYGI